MPFLFMLILSATARAQSLVISGADARFALNVILTDPSGEGYFMPRQTRLDAFEFTYTPSRTNHSPREMFYVDVFRREPMRLDLNDVELLKFGRGIASPTTGVSGYYLLLRLKPAVRARINGYKYIGLGINAYGAPQPPYRVLLLNDPADNAAEQFKPSLWHRLFLGDRIFLEPILECEGRLAEV